MKAAVALSAGVHKYGEVLAARSEDGAALRDGPSGLLRVNGMRLLRASGFLLWRTLRTTASLRQTGIRRSEGTEPR